VGNKNISQQFRSFASECKQLQAPLYEYISESISDDPDILAFSVNARVGQPVGNLFFASVRFLLLKGIKHPLSDIYKNVSDGMIIDYFSAYQCFRSFCMENEIQIKKLLSDGIVQTNVPARCCYLMPAFQYVLAKEKTNAISLIEIGPSAGLNLLWDQYKYRYSDGREYGEKNSTVNLYSEFRGKLKPVISNSFSDVLYRVGIDLNPIDLLDEDAILWLKSLVWPENKSEEIILLQAIQNALGSLNTINLIKGDAAELLTQVIDDAPIQGSLVVFDSHVMNQVNMKSRKKIEDVFLTHSKMRKIFHVSVGGITQEPEMRLNVFDKGEVDNILLGYTDAHGRWINWVV
jgi:hypothetical protein